MLFKVGLLKEIEDTLYTTLMVVLIFLSRLNWHATLWRLPRIVSQQKTSNDHQFVRVSTGVSIFYHTFCFTRQPWYYWDASVFTLARTAINRYICIFNPRYYQTLPNSISLFFISYFTRETKKIFGWGDSRHLITVLHLCIDHTAKESSMKVSLKKYRIVSASRPWVSEDAK